MKLKRKKVRKREKNYEKESKAIRKGWKGREGMKETT